MSDSVSVLLVEDSRADVYIIEQCLHEAGLNCCTTVISDGEAALHFLQERGDQPELIILDLNLPKLSGIDVLRELMNNSQLPRVPIVILTSSDSPRDKANAAIVPHSCFLRKPMDLDGFMQVGRSIHDFWRMSRAS
jgi:CheY-like chemotaxis protein